MFLYIKRNKSTWVPMRFHGTKKLLLTVSHNLWAQNQKIVIHGFEILGLGKSVILVCKKPQKG